MGLEQSQHANASGNAGLIHGRSSTKNTTNNRTAGGGSGGAGGRLQRGNTIAVTGRRMSSPHEEMPATLTSGVGSRPVSPPMSVCSDSDLPYISYTDRPIGDSPKFRNKAPSNIRNVRNSSATNKKGVLAKSKAKSVAHDIVVVRGATKKSGLDRDPEIQRLQSIPQFLPVMRGTLSLPAHRDPEVLERLQPIHLKNMCNRMQLHLNASATKVAADQAQITAKIKEVDYETTRLYNAFTEKQKIYASYAEQFSKIHHISQQLSRCNMLLNQNLESMETLNQMLDIEDRLAPFVWSTDGLQIQQ